MKKYDAIIISAGHNGLTNGTYSAKVGLDVLFVKKNTNLGGAVVARELHDGWHYSSCCCVCSMLGQDILRV